MNPDITQTNEDILEARLQQTAQAPRLTPNYIDSLIQTVRYHVFPGTTTTVCCIELPNGFTVTGDSACASPANFNAQVGREIAYRNAREKIWELEGYLLRQRMFEREQGVQPQ